MKYSVCEDIFANIMFELHIARVRVVRRFDSAFESRKKKKRGGGEEGRVAKLYISGGRFIKSQPNDLCVTDTYI